MSTNHTPNFNLSQWEKSDRVLMDDFNDDNRKIENAFFNHPSGELILTETVTEADTTVHLNVSKLDWSRYLMLILQVEMPGNQSVELSGRVDNEFCVYASAYTNLLSGGRALCCAQEVTHMIAVIFTLYSGDTWPQVLSISGGDTGKSSHHSGITGGVGEYPLNKVTQFTLKSGGTPFQPGDKITLWGVK